MVWETLKNRGYIFEKNYLKCALSYRVRCWCMHSGKRGRFLLPVRRIPLLQEDRPPDSGAVAEL